MHFGRHASTTAHKGGAATRGIVPRIWEESNFKKTGPPNKSVTVKGVIPLVFFALVDRECHISFQGRRDFPAAALPAAPETPAAAATAAAAAGLVIRRSFRRPVGGAGPVGAAAGRGGGGGRPGGAGARAGHVRVGRPGRRVQVEHEILHRAAPGHVRLPTARYIKVSPKNVKKCGSYCIT